MDTRRTRRNVEPESSWRVVEAGLNESFETSILQDDDASDINPSQSFASTQQFSQSFGGSQTWSIGGSQDDSLESFLTKAENDDQALLSSPFSPSVPKSVRDSSRENMSPRIRDKTGSDGLRRRRRSISPPAQREEETPPPPYQEHQEVSRSREVFGSVAQHVKATLAFLISLCAVSYLVILGFSITTGSLTESLSPICRLPGVSSLNLPICLPQSPLDAEEKQKKQPFDIDPFLEIQGEFARTVELALRELDITGYDKALEDLKSAGLEEKEEVLPHYPNFLGFIKSARQQFDEFHEELASTVSALSTLCGKAATDLTEESTGGLPSWANWNVWKHWILSQFKPGEVHEEWVLDTYATHLGRVFEEVSAVVGDGLRVVKGLDEAGDHFKKVHDIVQEEKEKSDAKKGRFDALAKWLGAGGPDDDKTGEQFDLVGKVDQQHAKTRKQVGELVTRLQDILAQLYALTKVGPFGQEVNQPLEHYRKKIEAQGDNLEATKIRIARFKNPE